MRVAVGGCIAAVNSFVTQPMDLGQFQRATLTGDAVLKAGRGESAVSGFLDGAERNNWEVVPLQFVVPGIGGKITKEAHETMKEQFFSLLRKAGPVDGVFLQLHGTAAAEHLDDCEGDLLAALHGLLGEKIPIIASLDGHANVTPLMVKHASMLIGVKTNPHYDFVPVGRQAAQVHGRDVRQYGDPDESLGAAGDGAGPAEIVHCARLADGAPDARGSESRGAPCACPGCLFAGRIFPFGQV
jgi:microcystin degradation protein MlrC